MKSVKRVVFLGLFLFFVSALPLAAHAGYLVPKLQIPIPGIEFSTDIKSTDGKVSLPFLAQYIAGVYKYATGLALITAAVMIVFGGFMYIMRSSAGDVSRAKEYISNAIVGLLLVFAGYAILNMIMPEFSKKMKSLEIEEVEANKFQIVNVGDWKKMVGSAGKPTGSPSYPYNPSDCKFVPNAIGIPTVESMVDCAVTISKSLDMNPCFAIVAMNYETGGLALPNIIGHDEKVFAVGEIKKFLDSDPPNRDLIHFWVGSGRKYLESGISYKKKEFPACNRTCGKGECATGEDLKASIRNYQNCAEKSVKGNDDNIDVTKPDLGLDWRFSHGIGPGQSTVFSNACNKSLPSVSIGGMCFTAQQLNDPYSGIWTSLVILKQAGAGNPGDIDKAWAGYAGTASAQSAARAAKTRACNPLNPITSLNPNGINICRGDFGTDREACEKENDTRREYNTSVNNDPNKVKPLIRCTGSCVGEFYKMGVRSEGCNPRSKDKNGNFRTCPPVKLPVTK